MSIDVLGHETGVRGSPAAVVAILEHLHAAMIEEDHRVLQNRGPLVLLGDLLKVTEELKENEGDGALVGDVGREDAEIDEEGLVEPVVGLVVLRRAVTRLVPARSTVERVCGVLIAVARVQFVEIGGSELVCDDRRDVLPFRQAQKTPDHQGGQRLPAYLESHIISSISVDF